MADPPSTHPVPSSIGPFRLIAPLGQGGFAPVWRAEEVYDGAKLRDVALKLFFLPEAIPAASPEAVQWRDVVVAEARALCRVEHPNIVRFYILQRDDAHGIISLVMEYVPGQSLAVLLREQGPFQPPKVLEVGISVAWALAAMHHAGLVHRDVKPENILQAAAGYKLIDFGIVVDALPSPGQGGFGAPSPPRITGTPGYIAPEYLERRGFPSPAGDLYALGVTLFKLATGSLPGPAFKGQTPAGPLFELIGLLLDPDPHARPRHADWVAREIEHLHAHLASLHAPSAALAPAPLGDPATATGLPAVTALLGLEHTILAPRSPLFAAVTVLLGLEHTIPVPLAPLFAAVRRACEGDVMTDAGAVLGELGLGLLRYAFALGMAIVAAAPALQLSGPLAEQLRSAARPTHASWCALVRALHEALGSIDPSKAHLLAFAEAPSLIEPLDALLRNASSVTTPEAWAPWLVDLLEGAAELFALPLRVLDADEPTLLASDATRPDLHRFGSAPPAALEDVHALVGDRWIRLLPWLSRSANRLLLPEAPAAPGRPWRAADPVSGERRDDLRLDDAVRRLLGKEDKSTDSPLELCQNPPLVGRAELLALLAHAAREAAQGHVRLVLITGPLGVGRTRLLEAAIDEAGIAPARSLHARCSPERRSPLRPLSAALGALPESGAGVFQSLQGAIERALMPAVLPGVPQGSDALEVVEDALLQAAAEAPVLLAIDDVQWADAQTLKLLQFLVERTGRGTGAKLLVLAAARDEPNASAPLRALLGEVRGRAHPGARHLALGPLPVEQAAALAQAVCPLDPDLERIVVRGSGRVPFFLVNALLVWRETGSIVWRKGAWRAVDERLRGEGVPGVAALVEARLASYFAPNSPIFRAALRALAAVALHGGGLPVEIILHIGGAEESLEEALEALVEGGILVVAGEQQEYGFAQEMVRQAVLNLVRQRPWFYRLHRALLDAIAQSPSAAEDAAFLATGYDKLGVRGEARAWLGRAMESAVHAGLFDEAAAFGDRLAALAEGPAARAAVELSIVRVLVRGRQLEAAKDRMERLDTDAPAGALSGGDPRLGIQRRILRLEVARGRSQAAEDPALIADADALADPALGCEARMALAGVLPDEGEAMELIDAAVELAERSGPALAFSARVLRIELSYAASRRDLPKAKADLQRALAIARSMSSAWHQIHIEGDLAVMEAELGSMAAAIERLRRLAEQAEARGMRGQLRLLTSNLATFLMREGQAAEAAEVAQRNADLAAEAGDPVLFGAALSLRAYALLCTGELDAALTSATEAEWLQRERDDPRRGHTLLRRAEILEAMGRAEEGLKDARAALELAEYHGQKRVLVTAVLWEKFYLACQGRATLDELREALAEVEASGAGQHVLSRRLIERVRAWLSNATRG